VRSTLAFLLLLVGVVLVPVATAGRWAHDALVPADGFVATVAPLATEPVVTGEVEDRLVAATTGELEARTGVGGEQVEPVVRLAVQRALADPAFARVWRTATRDVHSQIVDVLTGSSLAAPDVGLRLAPLSGSVRRELVAAGVPFAGRLPTVRTTVPLLPASELAQARGAFALLRDRAPVLPSVTLLLVGLGLLVAPRRASALGFSCLAVLIEIGVLACAVLGARLVSPDAVPGSLPTPVVHAVFDTLVSGLWRDLAVVAAGALLLLVGALVTGRPTRR
jgi:hypothetical protein